MGQGPKVGCDPWIFSSEVDEYIVFPWVPVGWGASRAGGRVDGLRLCRTLKVSLSVQNQCSLGVYLDMALYRKLRRKKFCYGCGQRDAAGEGQEKQIRALRMTRHPAVARRTAGLPVLDLHRPGALKRIQSPVIPLLPCCSLPTAVQPACALSNLVRRFCHVAHPPRRDDDI